MIKIIENGIKIIIVFFVLWFFKSFFTDLNDFFSMVNKNEEQLNKLAVFTANKEAEQTEAKRFYDENKIIIENTKISDDEIKNSIKSVFGDITNKKLGFFDIKDFIFERDTKIINAYKINFTLFLKIDSIFRMQEVDEMISREINKRIEKFNHDNATYFELGMIEKTLFQDEYKIQLILLNKWRNPNE
jgi:hypothetical protein